MTARPNSRETRAAIRARFLPLALGITSATPAALEAVGGRDNAVALMRQHEQGDWGCVDREDAATNDEALFSGARILSAYPIDRDTPCKGYGENCVWIITEADRSVTTLLLPSEY